MIGSIPAGDGRRRVNQRCQVAAAIGGGFTPFIATALVALGGGTWYWVAAYLGLGCLVSAVVVFTLHPATSPTASQDASAAELHHHRRA